MGRILAGHVGKKYAVGRKEHKLELRSKIQGKFLDDALQFNHSRGSALQYVGHLPFLETSSGMFDSAVWFSSTAIP